MATRSLSVPRPGRQVRIYADLPHHDETWASFLDRIAAAYKVDRGFLIAQITGQSESSRYAPVQGRLDAELYDGLLEALQVDRERLPNNSRGIAPNSMSTLHRAAYCPLCFLEDLNKQRTPYFRYQWAIPLLTTCTEHQCPLMQWRRVRYADHRILPLTWATDPRSSRLSECTWLEGDLRVIDSVRSRQTDDEMFLCLVRRIEHELIETDIENQTWRETHGSDYALAISMALRLGSIRFHKSAVPLAAHMRPSVGQSCLFGSAPSRRIQTWKQAESIIRTSPLDWRRSVLWFAAAFRYESEKPMPLTNGDFVRTGGEAWLRSLERVTDATAQRYVRRTAEAFAKAHSHHTLINKLKLELTCTY